MLQQISALLFEQECVIIPGLGAFVANPENSQFIENEYRITPPFKNLIFNTQIRNNDGLLANRLVNSLNISYSQAMLQIQEFTDMIRLKVQKGETVVLPGIGSFFLKGDQLVFEGDRSVNYMIDSFGLTDVHCIPRFIEQKEKKETIRIENKNKKVLLRAAVLAPLAGAALWLSVKTFMDPTMKAEFLNVFSGNSKGNVSTSSMIPLNPTPVVKEEITPALLSGETPEDARYFIIEGAYSDLSNARKALENLKTRGYDAKFAGQHKGLHLVSYRGYRTLEEAQNGLSEIRGTEQGQAWLLKK